MMDFFVLKYSPQVGEKSVAKRLLPENLKGEAALS
jgi:hypothetical protein